MRLLRSHLSGRFVAGEGQREELLNPATEEPLAAIACAGLERRAALEFARQVGGAALRRTTFAERGAWLAALRDVILGAREELTALSVANGGNTRRDALFDLDGAAFTLAAYAELGASLGARQLLADGDALQLGRTPAFHGQHVLVPRRGVAVHINAFNFPAWGLCGKAAPALLAGLPVVTKPASSSALVAARIVELAVEGQVFPEGALSLLLGPAADLLDHVGPQDVIAFTGSAETGRAIRGAPEVIRNSVRVNVEADSLNAAILGPDVAAGSATFELFVRDVLRDMTQKAGQKCTAIRRVLVPEALTDEFRNALIDRLSRVVVGDPAHPSVRMGPLATARQRDDVRAGINLLARDGRLVHADAGLQPVGVPAGRGFFVGPVLIELEPGAEGRHVHTREVFGPVASLVPYSGAAFEAIELAARAQGGLVASVYSEDPTFSADVALGLAPYHGRVYLGSAQIADQSPGPGTVLPQLVHGGPGRAGGGEELGGLRALAFYLQRTALEGPSGVIERLSRTLPK